MVFIIVDGVCGIFLLWTRSTATFSEFCTLNISFYSLICRKTASLDAAFSEANCHEGDLQQLCPIDAHFVLSLKYNTGNYSVLFLLSINYDDSIAKTLHALPLYATEDAASS